MGTKYHGGNGTMKSFLDEIDISCAINQIDVTQKRAIADGRTLCGEDKVAGGTEWDTKFNGFDVFDTSATGLGNWDYQSFAKWSAGALVNHLTLYGNSAGAVGREVLGELVDQVRPWSVSALDGLSGSLTGKTGTRVLALAVDATATGTGNGSGVNHGATTTETVRFTVRVTDFSGAGSITFKLQSSTDNGGSDAYADVATTTLTFTAPGIQTVPITAATEAYKRVIVSAFSGFTSVEYTATIGIDAN